MKHGTYSLFFRMAFNKWAQYFRGVTGLIAECLNASNFPPMSTNKAFFNDWSSLASLSRRAELLSMYVRTAWYLFGLSIEIFENETVLINFNNLPRAVWASEKLLEGKFLDLHRNFRHRIGILVFRYFQPSCCVNEVRTIWFSRVEDRR